MTCAQAIFSLFLLTPCVNEGGGHEAVEAAIANSARPDSDIELDAGRKPQEVLDFFNIKPGMTVLEVFSGGGYYTQILDAVVGSDGKVISHNNKAYMGYVGKQYNTRFGYGEMTNTEQIIMEADDLEPGRNSLDAALLILTYHDFVYSHEEQGWPAIDEAVLIDKLCVAIKPGGVLGIIDHTAGPGGDTEEVGESIHRIDPQVVKDALNGTCFELKAESDMLANADDDLTTNAWSGPYRRKTDRFVFRYVNAADTGQ